MSVLIYQHPWDARRRLAELGVPLECLQQAIRAGWVARLTCTDNDPPFIPGTEAWRFVVRSLREALLPRGWRKSDPANFSLVINDKHNINIVVASSDHGTCRVGGCPRTKTLKGLFTEAAIVRNAAAGDLFPETLEDDLRQAASILEYPTWILLIHITDDEFKSELSFPAEMEDGQILDWKERIFIPEEEEGPGTKIGADDDLGPDFDVPVKRKA